MKQASNLQQALRRLADTSPRDAAPVVEQRVLAAFRARRNRLQRALVYVAAAAACLLLAIAWFLRHSQPLQPIPAVTESSANITGAFVALPYGQSDVPLEQAVIVRVKLQPSEWSALGVPVASPRANAISADLLIGQDGVARAVRLVSIQ